eukprot:TRINITY_DN8955_c0_g1_i3.p1 TRINITY_DN8955_c0_g1~~TRINITY_DN8955_c0_g1_i3.p1  ORF type:complete len:451 (-),score=98.95 TRINITY_DN8955_c0_g1_i3:235-1527(-)
MADFASILSRVASNDLAMVAVDISPHTPGIPRSGAELVERVVAALATNTHVTRLELKCLDLTETDLAPLAEVLKRRDFDSLDLSANQLSGKVLLPALAVRKSLRALRLSGEIAQRLDHCGALANLKELDLSYCRLLVIPPAVLQMSQLEALNICFNPLRLLPDPLASLTNLKRLNVAACGFSEFPTVLLRLSRLEELTLSDNQITKFPDGISALATLRMLAALGCGLTKFPAAIARLAHLEVLALSRNEINSVPRDIENLRSLKELELSRCGLTEVPRALWTLANLEKLTLNSNPLATLPDGLGMLQKLRVLEIFSCQLQTLPFELQHLAQLERLDVSNTKITHLPVWLGSMRSLRVLKCAVRPGLVGVAFSSNSLVTCEELAARVCNSTGSSPEEAQKLGELLKEMVKEDPLRVLRIAQVILVVTVEPQ